MPEYAAVERVDRIQEDLDAISHTVLELLSGQRWMVASLRAMLGHLGVPEVTVPVDPGSLRVDRERGLAHVHDQPERADS